VSSETARATIDNLMDLDPYLLFSNAIRSPLTRQKYNGRLSSFFDFISLPPSRLEDRCRIFVQNCHGNSAYAITWAFKFVVFFKVRMEKKEIEVSTLYNYLKPIKLLCEMNHVNIKWRKITVGLYQFTGCPTFTSTLSGT